jgi:hypothetical protein
MGIPSLGHQRKQIARPMSRREDNIKVDLKEIDLRGL